MTTEHERQSHVRRGRIRSTATWLIAVLATACAALALHFGVAPAAEPGVRTTYQERTPMKSGEGIINRPSGYPVPETLDRVEAALRAKGVKIFARIDHSAEAATVSLTMRPTQLLIFGNPTAGTPVMLAAPTAAIDLPLKALAWQDDEGKVWLSYNDPAYLKHRFALTDDDVRPLAATSALIDSAVR
jgi:uncharacterized protein (DUF302 family)